MRRVTSADILHARATPAATVLLFITDRCPVGCAHCSVDSRPDSPRITDFALFEEVVAALSTSDFQLIGISGGEPFIERRGLGLATERLAAAGKDISIVTSGVWATSETPPPWISEVIRRCGCLVLSSDMFHSDVLPEGRFSNAARAVAREDVWIVTQVINEPGMVEHAHALLTAAFGPSWRDFAEIMTAPLLPYGRAAGLFQLTPTTAGRDFGSCRLARSPVLRYDGVMSVCCNENVIMGRGPDRLRRTARDRESIAAALADLGGHALYRAIAAAGPGVLTADPRLKHLAEQRFTNICQLCWSVTEKVGDQPDDRVLTAIADMAGEVLGVS
jgi:hypothetical protein